MWEVPNETNRADRRRVHIHHLDTNGACTPLCHPGSAAVPREVDQGNFAFSWYGQLSPVQQQTILDPCSIRRFTRVGMPVPFRMPHERVSLLEQVIGRLDPRVDRVNVGESHAVNIGQVKMPQTNGGCVRHVVPEMSGLGFNQRMKTPANKYKLGSNKYDFVISKYDCIGIKYNFSKNKYNFVESNMILQKQNMLLCAQM